MSGYRLIRAALDRQRHWLLLSAGLMLAAFTAGMVLLALSGWLITASALAGLGLLTALDIFTPGAGIRLSAITRTAARYGERLATHQATFRVLSEIRLRLFRRLLQFDEIQLRRLRRGDALNRLTADVETLDHLFAGIVGPISAALALTLAVAAGFVLLAGSAALGPVLVVLLGSLIVVGLTGRLGRAPSRRLGLEEPKLRLLATEGLEGIETLRACNRIAWQAEGIRQCSGTLIRQQHSLSKLDAIGQGLVTLTGLAGVWLSLLVGLWLYQSEALSGPVAVLMVLVMLGLNEAWQPLPSAWRRLARCRVAGERISALAEQQPQLAAPLHPVPASGDNDFEIADVTFAYQSSLLPVIEHFNLRIDAGERIALVGPSGGGKTTLALLLMRQIDPDAGCVRLGGTDLRQLDPDMLRQRIGYLSQRPAIFRDTLAENLKLARPDADDERLVDVLVQTGLGSLLDKLPDGLNTWLDEAGANVSGGEMRRIALARLMLADPEIVILDEPTTGLDPASAQAMGESLNRWLAGRTAILISHNPHDLPAYDRLITIGSDSEFTAD